MVILIGAGPGDPELITLKGLRRLRRADVVLYDRLIPLELLDETRHDAIRIDVGKRQGSEDLQQQWIHELMIGYAREGLNVVRLKGGDPFVFGRGGEEVQALIEAGVEWEVIPGVSSSIAGPSSAGIPVTHRDHNHGFMVIAGNKSHTFDSAEWKAARVLARAGGTVVVLMGLGRAQNIVEYLTAGGCSPRLPSAMIANATRPDQQCTFATLAEIESLAEKMPSPAILVIGSVVGAALVGSDRVPVAQEIAELVDALKET